ncbi:hypothetical protein EYF80_059411 [Liparis tanakae]|uniref:Uncharacterized protein n=1 Tax=Liparis tanakae TaxID=230148 RepID=A0A4Z2ENB7_9TELE|nr:hypothetical protein EYF80_059411 [Liparis tanakae]
MQENNRWRHGEVLSTRRRKKRGGGASVIDPAQNNNERDNRGGFKAPLLNVAGGLRVGFSRAARLPTRSTPRAKARRPVTYDGFLCVQFPGTRGGST